MISKSLQAYFSPNKGYIELFVTSQESSFPLFHKDYVLKQQIKYCYNQNSEIEQIIVPIHSVGLVTTKATKAKD